MAKKPKYPRPRVKELRLIYKGLMTTSVTHRIETLKKALQWYDQAMPYVESKTKTSEERLKIWEQFGKLRLRGIRSTFPGEQETSLRFAIERMEKYCSILHPYSVLKVYAVQEAFEAKMNAVHGRLETKYLSFLNFLRAVAPNIGQEKLRITVSTVKEGKKFGHRAGELVYGRDAAKQAQLMLRRRGALPLLVQELPALSRSAAYDRDLDGKFTINPERQIEAMNAILKNFVGYCDSAEAPRRLVRGNPAISASTERKTPRTVTVGGRRGFGKRSLIDGIFGEGSALGTVYETLKKGEWHAPEELQKISTRDIKSTLRVIAEKAPRAGYKLETDNGKVRLRKEAA